MACENIPITQNPRTRERTRARAPRAGGRGVKIRGPKGRGVAEFFPIDTTPNYSRPLLRATLITGEAFSNRACKTHSSPASAANDSGFVQIPLSQVPRRDSAVSTRLHGAGALAIGS